MRSYYKMQVDELERSLAQIKRRIMRMYWVRLLSFLLFVTAAIMFFQFDYNVIYGACAVVSLVVFAWVIKRDLKLVAHEKFLFNKLKINLDELGFLDFKYADRADGQQYSHLNPHLAADFDIFGKGSLFQYINRSSTQIGESKLAERMCRSEKNADIIQRKQQSISELSEHVEFVQNFRTVGTLINEAGNEVTGLMAWLNSKTLNTNALRALIVLMPLINIVCIILAVVAILPGTLLIIPLTASLAIALANIRQISRIHDKTEKIAKTLEKYGLMIQLIEKEEFKSEMMIELKQKLSLDNENASAVIRRLFKLLKSFDLRSNQIAYFVLNSLILFDFQMLYKLEKWKTKYRNCVPDWFETLSETDVLISYATFAGNNRECVVYPDISDETFCAEHLGHPLLPTAIRITNDVKFSGSPSVMIITGANMAGKSTFLRTITVNLVLAMNGAPVCARKMEFFPCDIMSSIKIQDSLTNNESYFYAELLRIKAIIEHVRNNPKTVVILDEILRGTNTKDKQMGSLGLLEKLISLNSVVIVATHDLVIGELENKYPKVVANNCFEVELTDDQLVFDYKLKHGISQKLNASFLMKKMDIIS